MVSLPYKSIGSRHEERIGEIGDYGLECCIFRKIEKPPFHEAILGRTPSDAYQKEGLPAETLGLCRMGFLY
jgi:hypothetical protein